MVRSTTTGKTAVNTTENGEMGNPMAEASLSHNQVRPRTAIQLRPSYYRLLEYESSQHKHSASQAYRLQGSPLFMFMLI